MKLNVTQAEILATEVQKQITEKSLAKKDAALEKQIKNAVEKRNQIAKQLFNLKQEVEKKEKGYRLLIAKLNKENDISLNNNTYLVDKDVNYEQVLMDRKLKSVPSVQTIKNKIVMKSLFGSEQEMQEFLQALINEYTD